MKDKPLTEKRFCELMINNCQNSIDWIEDILKVASTNKSALDRNMFESILFLLKGNEIAKLEEWQEKIKQYEDDK